MKGSPKVIEQLQLMLANELAAIDQYFIHSRMYEDWGLTRLFERINHESEEEKEHATALIRRILFLEGTPDMTQREGLRVGTDVPSMLANDLQLEYAVAAGLKQAIASQTRAPLGNAIIECGPAASARRSRSPGSTGPARLRSSCGHRPRMRS